MALTRTKPLVSKTALKRTELARGSSPMTRTAELARKPFKTNVERVVESLQAGPVTPRPRIKKPDWALPPKPLLPAAETDPSDTTVALVLERDSYCCVICGHAVAGIRGTDFHIHHRCYRSRGGHHRASNLITLCPRCHDRVHLGDAKQAEAKGWALPSHAIPAAIRVEVLTPDGPRRRYLTDDGRRIARKPRNLVTS